MFDSIPDLAATTAADNQMKLSQIESMALGNLWNSGRTAMSFELMRKLDRRNPSLNMCDPLVFGPFIDGLVEKGFVERTENYQFTLTDAGEAAYLAPHGLKLERPAATPTLRAQAFTK